MNFLTVQSFQRFQSFQVVSGRLKPLELLEQMEARACAPKLTV
jgi:hypothetical protein